MKRRLVCVACPGFSLAASLWGPRAPPAPAGALGLRRARVPAGRQPPPPARPAPRRVPPPGAWRLRHRGGVHGSLSRGRAAARALGPGSWGRGCGLASGLRLLRPPGRCLPLLPSQGPPACHPAWRVLGADPRGPGQARPGSWWRVGVWGRTRRGPPGPPSLPPRPGDPGSWRVFRGPGGRLPRRSPCCSRLARLRAPCIVSGPRDFSHTVGELGRLGGGQCCGG